jgi:Protein of unknown function (DUF3738)
MRDKTGLTEEYDFTLEFERPNFRDLDANRSIFTVVQEQLGVRLASATEPMAKRRRGCSSARSAAHYFPPRRLPPCVHNVAGHRLSWR